MRKFLYCFVLILIFPLWACASTRLDATPTELPEEAVVATEHWIQTQNALTRAVLPTFTPSPTLTPTQSVSLFPTLSPIPNSTPAGKGAYFDVPPDVLGPKYEIENAYYFDEFETGKRYEIYAGAVAGSGDEYTAQGVAIVNILRILEKHGTTDVESETTEYLTHLQVGHLRVDGSGYTDRYSGLLLFTSLDFVWFFNPQINEMYLLGAHTPLARLEIGGKTQVARLTGESSVFSTNPLPLTGGSPFIARLHLPLEESPDALSLSAILISPPGTLEYDDLVTEDRAEWRTDCPLCSPPIFRESMELGKLPLQRDQELNIILEPGFYGLLVHATWLNAEWFGRISATYSYLIEVQE